MAVDQRKNEAYKPLGILETSSGTLIILNRNSGVTMMRKSWFLPFSALLLLSFSYQDKKQQKVKQKDIDSAVTKGTKWLLDKTDAYLKAVAEGKFDRSNPYQNWIYKGEELVLYALIHADITIKNEVFKKLFDRVLATKPADKQTYNLAVEAMALVSFDKKKYTTRVAEIAQALVDRQCKNGQWTYKGTSHNGSQPNEVYTSPFDRDKQPKKFTIKRQSWGPEKGDNSNTQYAALGLRACFEAGGIEIDPDVLKLAKQCWEKCQNKDGGWDYAYRDNSGDGTGVQEQPKDVIEGTGGKSTGSMTIGGLGALASYKHMLKEDIKKDPAIKKAIEWMTTNFAVDKNPAMPYWHYYYLYGLERGAALTGLEKFGDHDWYQEGAEYLLKNQRGDGEWNWVHGFNNDFAITDTCFAILFLQRATEHLIETGN